MRDFRVALFWTKIWISNFLFSSLFFPPSQFGEIYQEEYFLEYLKNDVDIVKELPSHLQAVDVEAIGSQVGKKLLLNRSELWKG